MGIDEGAALHSPRGRGILVATALASGMAFLDGTVVNVALPTLGRELGASLSGLQWVVDAYLLTLSAFILLGGSLGEERVADVGHHHVTGEQQPAGWQVDH